MINTLLSDFISCWKMFNGKGFISDQEAAGQINRGDCGLTAIAVSYVLRHRYGEAAEIHMNAHHCWLVIPGKGEFDTLHPDGYKTPVKEVWDRQGGGNEQTVHFAQACTEWMPCDAHGGYLVKAFVERYGLPMPVELQHCIDQAAEYECPEAIPGLVARYQATLQVPVVV